jgi:hypothetical protein
MGCKVSVEYSLLWNVLKSQTLEDVYGEKVNMNNEQVQASEMCDLQSHPTVSLQRSVVSQAPAVT